MEQPRTSGRRALSAASTSLVLIFIRHDSRLHHNIVLGIGRLFFPSLPGVAGALALIACAGRPPVPTSVEAAAGSATNSHRRRLARSLGVWSRRRHRPSSAPTSGSRGVLGPAIRARLDLPPSTSARTGQSAAWPP